MVLVTKLEYIGISNQEVKVPTLKVFFVTMYNSSKQLNVEAKLFRSQSV